MPRQLTPREREALVLADTHRYITRRGGRDALTAAWWALCCAREMPYVELHARREYAGVTLDMLTTTRELSGVATDRAWQLIGHYALRGADMCVSPTLVTVSKVAIADADKLARALVALGAQPCAP